jgi:hypothetical protein
MKEQIILVAQANFRNRLFFHETIQRLFSDCEKVEFIIPFRSSIWYMMDDNKMKEYSYKEDIFKLNDGDSSTFSRIANEVSYLATCQVIPEFEIFEKEGYNISFEVFSMFGNILGLAAHTEMHQLLSKFNKNNKWSSSSSYWN